MTRTITLFAVALVLAYVLHRAAAEHLYAPLCALHDWLTVRPWAASIDRIYAAAATGIGLSVLLARGVWRTR